MSKTNTNVAGRWGAAVREGKQTLVGVFGKSQVVACIIAQGFLNGKTRLPQERSARMFGFFYHRSYIFKIPTGRGRGRVTFLKAHVVLQNNKAGQFNDVLKCSLWVTFLALC